MDIKQQEAHFNRVVEELRAILLKKGNDYAGEERLSAFKTVAAITKTTPEMVCLIFIATKITRISNLLDSGVTPENESLQDSVKDLTGYSILLDAIINEKHVGI